MQSCLFIARVVINCYLARKEWYVYNTLNMKQVSPKYRVLAPTALFGTVRVTRGDVIPRELLGLGLRKLVEQGIVEPMSSGQSGKRVQASLL